MAVRKNSGKAITKKKDSGLKARSDIASSYNRLKEYKGRRYTGMTIGRTHHWYYDKSD